MSAETDALEGARAMKEAIACAAAGKELDAALMTRAMQAMLGGQATPAQVAALLVSLRMKGESAAELAQATSVMREHCVRVELSPHVRKANVVDTCGTGGDGADTFNISTAAAIVVAAAGVPVAKHGNRAASSQAGSADVLEALGVRIELSAAQVARCVEQAGIGFMFARAHHPAMRHVAAVRSEIGVRTLFNFLGPLANPAGVLHQVIGVSEPRMLEIMADVLARLGAKRAMVVHGHGGLDEIALSGSTRCASLSDGRLTTFSLSPEDFGVSLQPSADLRGGDAAQNASMIRAILAGERGARRDAVVVNAAAALHVAGAGASLRDAAGKASAAIDSGAAAATLERWISASKAD